MSRNHWENQWGYHDPYISTLRSNYTKAYNVAPTGRLVNNADDVYTADYFMDSWLVAKKPVAVFTSPNGDIKALFETGDIVGRVFSYVTRDGKVWFQIDNPSGDHYGWVLSQPGTFDKEIALSSSSGLAWDEYRRESEQRINEDSDRINSILAPFKAIATGTADLVSGAGKTLGGLGENFGLLAGAVLVGLVIYAVTRFKLA